MQIDKYCLASPLENCVENTNSTSRDVSARLPESDICIDFDMNAYLNISVSRKRYERISDYIRIKRNDKNMIKMSIGNENDMNIRIFKYVRHTQIQMQIHIQKK